MKTFVVCTLLFSIALALLPVSEKTYERDPQIKNNYFTAKHPLAGVFEGDRITVAKTFLKMKEPAAQWAVTSDYPTKHNSMEHVYLRQVVNGIHVMNAVANVNVRAGFVESMGYSVFAGALPEPVPAELTSDYLDPKEAFLALLDHLDAGDKAPAMPEVEIFYVMLESNELALTYKMVVDLNVDVYESYVDAKTGEVHACYNWVKSDNHVAADADYTVYQYPITDPNRGERSNIPNPWSKFGDASPEGYHDQGTGSEFEVTIGNNVYAQENRQGGSSWENNYRPDGGNPSQGLLFNFPINFAQEPRLYEDAAITNLFYWNNLIHDLFHVRGFDEASGNFQENNWGRGGLGNDAVQANAQDGAGYNNANFFTPPDGQRPRMRMYLWTTETPYLDGDLDSGIIVHEYGHGISNRLTGGPSVVNCLNTAQSGGMGEGWGDWWAIMLETVAADTADTIFPMGLYAAGRGIRPFPYTYSMTANPQTFGYISQSGYGGVHAKGSVWCEILYNVYWELRMDKGYDADWINGNAGNNILWQNVVDGLKLQPCRPTFTQARDAIIEADRVNYGGQNICTMWKGFARRGLGVNADANSSPVREDFDVPSECM